MSIGTQTRPPRPETPEVERPDRIGLGRRIVGVVRDNTLSIALLVMLLWLIGGPLYYLVRMSFGRGNPVNPGPLTLANFEMMLGDTRTYTALLDTVIYSLSTTAISLILATAAAWLVERTDLPGRNLAWIVMLAPLAIPGSLSSMAWILLLSPQSGAINVWLRQFLDVFGITVTQGPFNIFSLPGMIFVEGFRGTTTLFLMIVGAFRLMDPSMEDAASMSGSNRLVTLRRITVPLLAPALLAATIYAFLGNLQDFDTPLLLGIPAGIFILPTLIYFLAYVSAVPSWGLAAAYASLFLVVLALLTTWYYKVIIKHSRRFQTVVGKAYRPQRIRLGRLRYVALGGFALFFLASIGLPLLILLWASLLPVYRPPSIAMLDNLTLQNFTRLIGDSRMHRAFRNSFVLGVGTASIGMGVAFFVSWSIVRMRVKGALLLDSMAFLPNALPAISIGLGFIIFYLSPAANWTGLYGTVSILILALVVNYLAFSTRLGNSAMVQLSAELEEQAWVAGYSKISTFVRISWRLLMPTFIAGWVWVFAHAVRNLTMPLLMSSGNRSEVIAQRLYMAWAVEGDTSFASAIAVVLLGLLLLFAFAARRLIMRGFAE